MRCLGEVRSEMTAHCPTSSDAVATQYELHLIKPLVELTRSFVIAECAMSEQYRQYFVVTAHDVTYRTASSAAVVCSALVALAVARWLVLLAPPQ